LLTRALVCRYRDEIPFCYFGGTTHDTCTVYTCLIPIGCVPASREAMKEWSARSWMTQMHCRRVGCSRCRRWSPRKCCFCAYGASTSRPTAYANVHRLRSPDCEKAVCCICTVDLPMKWMYWTDLFTEAGDTPIYSHTATAHEGAERATTDQITRFRDTARDAAYILVAGLKSMCQSIDLVECHMFEGSERATRYQRRGCAVRLPRVPDRTTKPCSVPELVVSCRPHP
jgi:hypothetical protein